MCYCRKLSALSRSIDWFAAYPKLAFVLLLGVLSVGFSSATANAQNKRLPSELYILNLGDSIAAGWKCQKPVNGKRICEADKRDQEGRQNGGYVPEAIKLISARLNLTVQFYNEAVGGATTADLYANLPNILDKHPKATYAFILTGSNDDVRSGNLGCDIPGRNRGLTTGHYLLKVVNELKARGVSPILSTLTPNSCGLAEKNNEILAIAQNFAVEFNDTHAALAPYWNTETICNADNGDALHVSACGDRLIAISLSDTMARYYQNSK